MEGTVTPFSRSLTCMLLGCDRRKSNLLLFLLQTWQWVPRYTLHGPCLQLTALGIMWAATLITRLCIMYHQELLCSLKSASLAQRRYATDS